MNADITLAEFSTSYSPPEENVPRKLLVLDLNGLLLYSKHIGVVDKEKFTALYPEDIIVGRKLVSPRPGLHEFLEKTSREFDIAIWTSMVSSNAKRILNTFFTEEERSSLIFVYDQSHCINTGLRIAAPGQHHGWEKGAEVFLKPFDKIWTSFPMFDESNTLLVDDSPYKAWTNPEWGSLHPRPFVAKCRADRDDNFLLKILWPCLRRIAFARNVRQYLRYNEPKWSLDCKSYEREDRLPRLYAQLTRLGFIKKHPRPVVSYLQLTTEELPIDHRLLINSMPRVDDMTLKQIVSCAQELKWKEAACDPQDWESVQRARVWLKRLKMCHAYDCFWYGIRKRDDCMRDIVEDQDGSRRTCYNIYCNDCLARHSFPVLRENPRHILSLPAMF